jgi:hypothetical protein
VAVLQAIGVGWDRATPAECRDFVLWLQQARKPISDRRTRSAARVGTLNPVTRKQYLTDQYAPRTVRHSNAVLRAFYEFWIEEGPIVGETLAIRQQVARTEPTGIEQLARRNRNRTDRDRGDDEQDRGDDEQDRDDDEQDRGDRQDRGDEQ